MNDNLTNIVLMWENKDGSRHWDAISKNQFNGFIKKLEEENEINFKSLIIGYNPIVFHWVLNKYHTKGLSDVCFANINKEIAGLKEPYEKDKNIEKEKSNYNLNVPIEKEKPESKFGWISPDGRYFHCEYYGHYSLAEKIVGHIEDINNPELYLENKGWLRIISSVYINGCNKDYDIIMGENKFLTDEQFKTLNKMNLLNCHNIKYYNDTP